MSPTAPALAPHRALVVVMAAVVPVLTPAAAPAAPTTGPAAPAGIHLVARGRCPRAPQLQSALTLFLPSRPVRLGGEADARLVTLSVTDLGARYRVEVAGLQKIFVDGKRRCEERARAAAVFAALTLEPPVPSSSPARGAAAAPPVPTGGPSSPAESTGSAGSPSAAGPPATPPPTGSPPAAAAPTSPPPQPPATPPASPPATTPPAAAAGEGGVWARLRRLHLSLEVAALLSVGADTRPLVTGGLSLRLVASGEAWGVALGFEGLPWAPRIDIAPGSVRLGRFPLDLDLRRTFRFDRLELVAEAGISFTPTTVTAEGLVFPETTFPLAGLGGRVSGLLRVITLEQFRPYFGFEVLAAGSIDLTLRSVADRPGDPPIIAGHATTPYIWIGVMGGFAWNFD